MNKARKLMNLIYRPQPMVLLGLGLGMFLPSPFKTQTIYKEDVIKNTSIDSMLKNEHFLSSYKIAQK